ncbi:MAG: hypothetical protein HY867_06595 [Chloroflexi bacterium]|nr:hypothetical protein [Chloroflexota bacterium]
MIVYDLCLARNWEYDSDFARILDSACAARGMTLLDISAANLAESLSLLSRQEAAFRSLLDRASEADSSYLPLVDMAQSFGARRFNPRELADRAYDKASLHHAFLEEGIPTPRTIILPAYLAQPELPPLDLASLGKCFTAKPALGGGGDGVALEISTLEQIQAARKLFPEQQYLLQEHVTPKLALGLPAWFRVIYCLGDFHVSFWDTTTHVYTPLTPAEETGLGLWTLLNVTRRIARLCQLDLFSTEICLTEENRLVVVDYVNDPIDLRLQSKAKDGIPDFMVEQIAARIVEAN